LFFFTKTRELFALKSYGQEHWVHENNFKVSQKFPKTGWNIPSTQKETYLPLNIYPYIDTTTTLENIDLVINTANTYIETKHRYKLQYLKSNYHYQAKWLPFPTGPNPSMPPQVHWDLELDPLRLLRWPLHCQMKNFSHLSPLSLPTKISIYYCINLICFSRFFFYFLTSVDFPSNSNNKLSFLHTFFSDIITFY